MKRIILAILALTFVFGVACSSGNGNEESASASSITESSEAYESQISSEAETPSSEESTEPDTVKPVIRVTGAEPTVLKKGEDYDLLTGVLGRDNADGMITEKIQIDKGGFDPDIPGEYMIKYELKDSSGNEADPKTRTVIVRNTEIFTAPPIWESEIPGEITNPEAPAIYGGAWYHKVVSSKDKWVGIEATFTVPEIKVCRYNGEYDHSADADPDVKNLDNPSIYFGGNAKNESDVGLSLSRVLIDASSQKISTGSVAFRPFWRYITSTDKDVGDYAAHNGEYAVSANGNNCIANYHWKYTEYYYLPGDTLRMIVLIPEPDKMQLQIEVISESTLPSSVAIREKYGWKSPESFVSPVFRSPGHGTGIDAEYKRVNAIDQSGNEGKTAIPTDTEVKKCVWHETYLYREIEGTMYRVPMNANRCGVTNAPDTKHFTVVSDNDNGGETVTIHPGYTNG